MADIDKELRDIKNAVYGREVRGSIHDGIKKINEEVEDSTETSEQAKHQVENIQEQVDNLVVSGDSSVEAAQARVDKDNHNYSTLKDRLDTEQQQFETQLADEAQQRISDINKLKNETTNKIDNLDNRKMDKNTTDISIHQINKNKGLIDETYLSDELKQQMAGNTPIHSVPADDSVTNEKLSRHSVSIDKLDFAKTTKNLFAGYQTGIIDFINGNWVLSTYSETGIVAVVPVENNTTYYIRKFGSSDRFRIAGTILEPSFNPPMNVDQFFNNNHNLTSFEVDTLDCNYLIIQISNSLEMPNLQITKDEDYDYYMPPAKIRSDYVESYKFGLLASRTDRLNFNWTDNKIEITGEMGLIHDSGSFVVKPQDIAIDTSTGTKLLYYDVLDDKVKIITYRHFEASEEKIPFGTYTFSIKEVNGINNYSVNGIPVTKNTASYRLMGRKSRLNFDFLNKKIEVLNTIYAVSDHHFMLLNAQTLDISDVNYTQSSALCVDDYGNLSHERADFYSPSPESPKIVGTFNVAEQSVSGIEMDYLINGNPVNSNDDNKPRLFGNFNTLYKSPEMEDVRQGADFDVRASTIEDIYEEYDELLNIYGNIMSKRLLGYGSDENGNEDESLPIYEYTINNPHKAERNLPDYSPTILLVTGLHGSEKSPPWSTVQFFKQLLNDWQENDTLSSIKNNVQFKVIPVLNPGGYNDNTRRNRRGVDLNRNFLYRWDESTASSEDKGEYPYSELETKIARDWIAENRGNKTIYIDFHNTFERFGSSYISTPNSKLGRAYSSMMHRLSAHWDYRYKNEVSENTYGWIENNQNPMSFTEAYHINGIDLSAMLEIAMDYDGVYYTKEVIERSVEILANYIQVVLNVYNDSNV